MYAYDLAFHTDSESAFGGIIAFNRELDADTASDIVERQFVEVIIAPAVSDNAQSIIGQKKTSVCCKQEPGRHRFQRATLNASMAVCWFKIGTMA